MSEKKTTAVDLEQPVDRGSVAERLSGPERDELEQLRARLAANQAEELGRLRAQLDAMQGAPMAEPAPEEPEGLRARLVLATGRTVEAVNANTTEHFDDAAGLTVPVVSAYTI